MHSRLHEPYAECRSTARLTAQFSRAAKPICTIIKQKHSRWWEVHDPDDELVCLTLYRKGAREVVRRLAA
jgi:hypothetical protein